MYQNRFSQWCDWQSRAELKGIQLPGVYALAYSTIQISGQRFTWRDDIIYMGMTNSAAGLKGRLKKFDKTIAGKSGHGGADRVRYKYQDYGELKKRLFVSVAPFQCDPMSGLPKDLKIQGDVAQFEFYCLAQFVKKFGRLPEFNDRRSVKFSRMASPSMANSR